MTGYYDGSGYHIDFPTNSTDFTYDDYRYFIMSYIPNKTISQNQNQNLITMNTRCLIIMFALYNWATDQFVSVMIVKFW